MPRDGSASRPSDSAVTGSEHPVTARHPTLWGPQIDVDRLEWLRGEGLLRSARHPEADLAIWNYTERCQYGRLWDPITLACRGLITDFDGNIVARPFGKFFNLGEPSCPGLPKNEPFEVTEKIDGSLGILYELDGNPRIATRGSFVSKQALRATTMLAHYSIEHTPAATPLFEIVYPDNKIVVDYGDREELILLASIEKTTGLDRAVLPGWSGERVGVLDGFSGRPHELHKYAQPNEEGFVLHYRSIGLRVKVKFEEYVRLHRVISGLNEHRIWEATKNGDDLDALIQGAPDEVYDFVKSARDSLLLRVRVLKRTAEMTVAAVPLGEARKETARRFFDGPANPGLCFSLLDGRDIEKQLWKLVEPKKEAEGAV